MTTEFCIRIDCDNEAFEQDPAWEVARLLRKLADRLSDHVTGGITAGAFRDINGNTCGAWAFTKPGTSE